MNPSDPDIPGINPALLRAIERANRIPTDALRGYGAFAGSQAFEQTRKLAAELLRQQKQIRRLVGSLDGVIDQARRLEEQRQTLLQQVFGSAEKYELLIAQIRKQVLGPLQAMRELDEKEQRLASILASRGWVISPSLPISATHSLLRIHDEQGMDTLEETLIAHYDAETLEQLLESCYDRPTFAARRHLFEPALGAHRRGEYVLSVPVWLMQIDGIVFDELAIDDVFSKVKNRKRRQKLQQELGGANNYGEHMLTGLMEVLEAAGESTRQATAQEIRRHLVLHGIDLGYGTERNSIQGVLMLELLHMFFDAHDRQSEAA